MAHERNVEGLRKSAQFRHQQTIQRTEQGIRLLLQDGKSINFNTVAQAAGVSTAWLYQHPEVRSRIEHLRAQQSERQVSAPKSKASDASKDAMLATLRQRVKQVEAENRELKRQLEVLYGQLYKNQP
jgi:Family of unknown function (DUF6262)